MQIHINTLSPQLQTDSQSKLFRVWIIQSTVNGCCDFIAQCILVRINHSSCTYHPFYSHKPSKIYRCWIIWGKNIRVVIIPLFMAVTYLGQSIYLHLLADSKFQFIASRYLATGRWWNNSGTRRNFGLYLGDPVESNRFGRVHGRECPGDWLDCV